MAHFKPGAIKVRRNKPIVYNQEHVKPKTVEVITLKRLTPSIRLTFHGINQDDTYTSRPKRTT